MDSATESLIERQFREGLADFYMSGPWAVVSDYPALAVACGGYRVVQTPNQNNYRHFGPSDRWYGIEDRKAAEHIARCSPDNIALLLAELEALRSRCERMERALAAVIKANDEAKGGLSDCIDNTGDGYQSQYFADIIAAARALQGGKAE